MRNKWIYAIVVLALGFFASCSDSDDQPDRQKTRTVVFTLAMDKIAGSRAAWGTNEDAVNGTGIENRIDLKGLRVAIYPIGANGQIGTRVGVASNLFYQENNDNSIADDKIEYLLMGDITNVDLTVGQKYRFMVYANFPNDNNNTFDLEDVDVKDGYIPMWGVATCQITDELNQDLGTIDLLRAAAKVEVNFASTVTAEYDITALGIRNYNELGDILPNGFDTCQVTKNLDMDLCMNVEPSPVYGTPLSFLENKSASADTYTLYMPEYDNQAHVAEEQTALVVTVKHKTNGMTKEYQIPFCKYNADGTPIAAAQYNIVRNHIYQFNVTGVAVGKLMLNLSVSDWTAGSSLELGSLAYPTYKNPVLPDPSHTYPQALISTNPTMKYVSASDVTPFTMYFNFIDANVTGLSGYVWKPTIVDASSANYRIEVYKQSTPGGAYDDLVYEAAASTTSINELETADNKYTGWFQINVIPTSTVATDTEFTFGIACGVHPSGFPSEDFFLFINGENNQIAWPNSGIDRKFIVIKQEHN